MDVVLTAVTEVICGGLPGAVKADTYTMIALKIKGFSCSLNN